MTIFEKIAIDTYTIKARLLPSLFALLPLILVFICLFGIHKELYEYLLGIIVSFGVLIVLSNIGRDSGKKKEKSLYRIWGGKPTTVKLSHFSNTNPEILKRYHSKLTMLLPDIKLPNKDEERNDKFKAYSIYDSCVSFLIENTRDKEKHNLIFEENVNYGFRRNLWGFKPYGIIFSTASIIIITTKAYINNFTFEILDIFSIPVIFLLLLLWIFWFTNKWVKIAADAYAERLLASIDLLSS